MSPALEARALTKRFDTFLALDGVSFEVGRGEVVGFLGPNGAGKTTTLKILMGMYVPTSGQARMLGLDCQMDRVELKRHVGYLPDTPVYYDYLRGSELLRFVGRMHGLDDAVLAQRIPELLERMDLGSGAEEFAMNYSMGMKKKLALAMALLHEPQVLLLDEPTTGLDPHGAREIRGLIRTAAEAGRTVLLSTHLMEMAERLCDRVVIIHQGRIVADGPPVELSAQLARGGSLEEVFVAVTADTPEVNG